MRGGIPLIALRVLYQLLGVLTQVTALLGGEANGVLKP